MTAKSSDPVKQSCLDGMGKIFNYDILNMDEPLTLFNAFIFTLCLTLPLDVPSNYQHHLPHIDGVKASSCFYSGYFLTKFMVSKKSSKEAIETLKLDFCNKYATIIPNRTAFIQALKTKGAEAADFDQACLSEL